MATNTMLFLKQPQQKTPTKYIYSQRKEVHQVRARTDNPSISSPVDAVSPIPYQ